MLAETDQKPVDPQRALELGVGVASPLWPGFLVAASAGVAFWWWSQWARGQMLNEIQLGNICMPMGAPPKRLALDPVSETLVQADPTPVVEAAAVFAPVADATLGAAAEVTEAVFEAAGEAIPKPVVPPPVVVEPPPAPEVKAAPVPEIVAPKIVAPKAAPPKPVAAKAKTAPPKVELPKVEPPKAEAPKLAAAPAPVAKPAPKRLKTALKLDKPEPKPTPKTLAAAPAKVAAQAPKPVEPPAPVKAVAPAKAVAKAVKTTPAPAKKKPAKR